MVRPKLSRTIQSHPDINGFHPSGAGERDEIVLSLEEFEAVRLIDFEGLDQTQASSQMGISRQTFGRILKAARFIITKALVIGLQLKVTGGCYQVRGKGQRNGAGGQRRHHGMNNMEQQRETIGDTQMNKQRTSQNQDTTNNSNTNPTANGGQGRGQGKGQGQGKSGGQGRGRGQGGGKGNGSCRQS